MTRINLITAFAVLAFFSLVPLASATVIGDLSEANCAGGGVTVSLFTITWSPVGTVAGTGCINTGIGTSLTYSGGTLSAGATGNIKSLTAGGGDVDQFMTFLGTSLDFVLTGLGPAAGTTNCAALTLGQSCVAVAGSPFLLTLSTSAGRPATSVTLDAFGTILDGGVTSNWFGSFTTQLNMSPSVVQSTILGGGSISSAQSGQFTVIAGVPEPATYSMIGAGLIGLAMILRKRRA